MSRDSRRHRRSGRWLRGSTAKRWLMIGFERLSRVAPDPLLRVCVGALARLLHWSYRLPRHPIRAACEDVALLARRSGYPHEPRAVFDELIDQLHDMSLAYLELYRRGREPALARTRMATEELRALLEEHPGVVVAVSHNVGAVYASIGLDEAVPTLVVVKGQKDPTRELMAREFFQDLGVDAVLVRDMGATTLARTCLRALRQKRVLVATMDLLYRKPNRLVVRMFGQEVGLAPWAFRFAAKLGSPVVPAYVQVRDGIVSAAYGKPLVDDSVERLAEHYARFLEDWILRDPASWAFLGDKRWRQVLRSAAAAAARPTGGA
jgi:lauroyl/myristoyl acyltransferase